MQNKNDRQEGFPMDTLYPPRKSSIGRLNANAIAMLSYKAYDYKKYYIPVVGNLAARFTGQR